MPARFRIASIGFSHDRPCARPRHGRQLPQKFCCLEFIPLLLTDCLARARRAAAIADWPQVSQQLRQYLSNTDAPPEAAALELALAALQRGDFPTGWEIAQLLPRFGAIARPALIALLDEAAADPDTRWLAARCLSNSDAPEAIAALARLLQTTDDDELAAVAQQALATAGPRAIPALANLLESPGGQLAATSALAHLHAPEAIAPLLRALALPRAEIRALALAGLSRYSDPHLPAVFATALGDRAAAVRREAASALGLWANREATLDLLAWLAPCLADRDPGVCQQAAIALSRLNTPAAAAALRRALQQPAVPVPQQCDLLRALGWLTVPQRLEDLHQALHCLRDPAAQIAAIRSLGRAAGAEERAIASRSWLTGSRLPQASLARRRSTRPSPKPGNTSAVRVLPGV